MGLFDEIPGLEIDDEAHADAPESLDAPRIAAHAQLLPEVRITGSQRAASGKDADLDEHTVGSDLAAALDINRPVDADAADRLYRRVARIGREVADSPGHAALSALGGVTLGGFDELLSSGARHPLGLLVPGTGGLLSGLDEWLSHPEQADQIDAATHDAMEEAHDRLPHAHDVAETAGTALGAVALPEVPVAEGAGWLTRAATRAGETGLLTGLQGALSSDGDVGERLQAGADAATAPALLAGGASALGSAGRAAGRAIDSQVARLGRGAAEARVASASGSRPGADAMRSWRDSPGGIEGSADRVRRLELVSPAATTEDVHDAARQAIERLGEGGELGSLTRELQESGARVPVGNPTDVPGAPGSDPRSLSEVYTRIARDLEELPSTADAAAGVRRRQDQTASLFGDEVDPAVLRRELAALQEGGRIFRDPRMGEVTVPTQAARDLHEGMSGLRDRVAEDAIGPGTAARYAQIRRDLQTAMLSRDLTGDAMLREGGNRTISPSDYAMGAMGFLGGSAHSPTTGAASGLLGLGLGLGNRFVRQRDTALRATTDELAHRIATGPLPPALRRWADVLGPAISRGVPRVMLVMRALEATDPDFAAALDEMPADALADPFSQIEGLEISP